jgi:hypothetical protein
LALSDFDQSLENLSAEELMKMMRSYLSKGVAACQKGFMYPINVFGSG